MFRYRLRTLLIVLAPMPPMLAAAWWVVMFEHPINRLMRENELRNRREWEHAVEAAKEWTRTHRERSTGDYPPNPSAPAPTLPSD